MSSAAAQDVLLDKQTPGSDNRHCACIAAGGFGLGDHHHAVDVGLDGGCVLDSRDDHQLEAELAERLERSM
jgi:hypothetical protein